MNNVIGLPVRKLAPKKKAPRPKNLSKRGKWDLSKPTSELDAAQLEIINRVVGKINVWGKALPPPRLRNGMFPSDVGKLLGERAEDVMMAIFYNNWRPRKQRSLYLAKWYPPAPNQDN